MFAFTVRTPSKPGEYPFELNQTSSEGDTSPTGTGPGSDNRHRSSASSSDPGPLRFLQAGGGSVKWRRARRPRAAITADRSSSARRRPPPRRGAPAVRRGDGGSPPGGPAIHARRREHRQPRLGRRPTPPSGVRQPPGSAFCLGAYLGDLGGSSRRRASSVVWASTRVSSSRCSAATASAAWAAAFAWVASRSALATSPPTNVGPAHRWTGRHVCGGGWPPRAPWSQD